MTIKRDILGTIVNIELTEQELTNAHIAYLEQEIKALKAGTPSSTPIVKSAEIMPAEQKRDYMSNLRMCADELRKLPLQCPTFRHNVISKYENDIREAYRDGISSSQISIITGITHVVINRYCRGIKRTRNMMVA